MSKPRLLDLFSGAGGAARGYQRAGFYVVGIDNRPQPRYAGDEFFQADAMTFPLEGFDAIHASPPCQGYSSITFYAKSSKDKLIEPVRERLIASGEPYVIENVYRAPLRNPMRLCGSAFGLGVYRHRLFESNAFFALEPPCKHSFKSLGIYGHIKAMDRRHGGVRRPDTLAEAQAAMGIGWMTWPELCEAIPPAYAQWIGKNLMDALKASAA